MKLQTKIEKLAEWDGFEAADIRLALEDFQWKIENIPGYAETFVKANDSVDLTKQRKWLDKTHKKLVKKGYTGLKKSSNRSRNIKIVLVIAGTVYVLNELGYLERVKQAYRRGKLYAAAVSDPESQEYKDLVDAAANKIQTFVDGEPHYKNRHTVPGETVVPEDTPEQQENLRTFVQETASAEDEEPKQTPSQES